MDNPQKMLLSYSKTIDILNKYQLNHVSGIVTDDANELRWNFLKMNKPVVLKATGKTIFHKTEKGQVILNINSPEELDNAVNKIRKTSPANADFEFLLQPQISGGEIIVGGKNDSNFGPIILFGMGGIYAQMINDVATRPAPISKKSAGQLILSTKANAFCEGFRSIKVDRKILENFVVRASKLIANEKKVVEFDFNPVIVGNFGATIVDAKLYTYSEDMIL